MEIIFIGSGAISTSLGQVIAAETNSNVSLISIEKEVIQEINEIHCNSKYFPGIKLSPKIKAFEDQEKLAHADIIFMGIPSGQVCPYLEKHQRIIRNNTIIVNLAKGFSHQQNLIALEAAKIFKNPVCTLKGPSFSRELINRMPTSFTLGTQDELVKRVFSDLFNNTCIRLDFSEDIVGVELLSILKNIYAISMGIIDANFNSANLRFLFLTKALEEIKKLLIHLGGETLTLFNYCGIGDFGLTALNDLSRNRTLGLLIGKGFYTDEISDKVTLEGKIATSIICQKLINANSTTVEFPIIKNLEKLFENKISVKQFVSLVI